MFYVLEVRRNLISGSLLSGTGYTFLFQPNIIIVTKYESFVEKCYVSDGLFEINI
jgi:hypothetical protein